jgi:excinuclease ABC subunit B
LRSETSLIQTIGRAARNSEGRVVMYADTITDSMKRAIGETNRRRQIQDEYNKAHGIVPKTIIKEVKSTLNITKKHTEDDIKMTEIPDEIEKLTALMKVASGQLDFERAIEIREKIAQLKIRLRKAVKK